MILWTMQPIEIWNLIQDTGVYRCDALKSSMQEPEVSSKYQWLIRQMEARIGPPPEGVVYPVWAWYKQKGQHKKPDLRGERWCYGPGNEKYSCIEFEVPDNKVLLSDFDAWSIILCNGLLNETKAEDHKANEYFAMLSLDEQIAFKEENWKKVFDISQKKNKWMTRGDWVQATLWELRKESIRYVRFFVIGKPKQ